MLADNFHCPVKTVDTKEGPALGVAILAGVGTGLYGSVPEACEALIHGDVIQNPLDASAAYYDRAYPLYQQLYRDLKDSFVRLAAL